MKLKLIIYALPCPEVVNVGQNNYSKLVTYALFLLVFFAHLYNFYHQNASVNNAT